MLAKSRGIVRRTPNIREHVHIEGFHEREALAKYFATSDIFVLPSLLDPGPIVISEALASGLFVVASRYDAIAPDLIVPGENGMIVAPGDIEGLRSSLEQAIERAASPRFDRRGVVRSVDGTPERYAKAFVDAVSFVLQGTPKCE